MYMDRDPDLNQDVNVCGTHQEVAQYLIKALQQGLFPNPQALERMAASSDNGRYYAERVIEAIEADPTIAERYAKLLDDNIDFGQCG
jgi:hypothetical protein